MLTYLTYPIAAGNFLVGQPPLTLVTQRFAPCSHASRRVVGMRELLDQERRRGDQARDTHDRKDLTERQLPARELGHKKRAGDATKAAQAQHPSYPGRTPLRRVKA